MTAILLDVEVIEGKKVQEIIKAFEEENNLESRMAHIKNVEKKEEEA